MLCDLMLEDWIDPKMPSPTADHEDLITALRQAGEDKEKVELIVDQFGRGRWRDLIKRIDNYERRMETCVRLCKGSVDIGEIGPFQEKVRQSHKFFLTNEFASASLAKMATGETVLKAREWFRLIHDPMWLEWQIAGLDHVRMGALFYSRPTEEGEDAVMCYVVAGVKGGGRKGFTVRLYRILPDTLTLTDTGYALDLTDEAGRELAEQDSIGGIAVMAYDFIVRLNSPRITDFRPCDDLTKINKKRHRLGRMPLCVYQIVDLNKTIKLHLQQADAEGPGGVRFHWRRGHFKARKTGLFWWNPHTAGRKIHGEIKKDYAA